MACMCGDLACPSCGPAQGADPEKEKVLEWLLFDLLLNLSDVISEDWLADQLIDRLGRQPQPLVDAIQARADEWCREQQKQKEQDERLMASAPNFRKLIDGFKLKGD